MSVTAGSIVTRVRDLIADPVYSSTGVANPSGDGEDFRASTLYNFLDDAIGIVVQRTGWVVQDWTAYAVVSGQPNYVLDPKWINIDDGFKDIWRLQRIDEAYTYWPNLTTSGKSSWFSTHRVTDHWEIGLFPAPNTNEPTPTLVATLSNTGTTASLSSVSSFNSYGYMSVDNEIVFYGSVQSVSGAFSITPLQRGQCGTSVSSHNNGALCTHLTVWFKGRRMPLTVATASDVVELPLSFLHPLQTYVLARCREMTEEFQQAAALMKQFDEQVERIRQDPAWRENQGMQIMAYGEPALGGLAFGRLVIPILVGLVLWWW
jgi:hypothetical protein